MNKLYEEEKNMTEIIATVESIEQAKALIPLVDTIFFGEETFGLRLPSSFTRQEQRELVEIAHVAGKKAMVAVNGIMHPEKMKQIPEYLAYLKKIGVDKISVGDTGVIYVMRKNPDLALPFIYAGETLVVSARQINFWAKKGATGAILAREVPIAEMQEMIKTLEVPVEVLVYGATCIHQSKRPLLQNYYNFTEQDEKKDRKRDLFLSEPKKEETHYSIYEDSHGTHVFANNDISLMEELGQLYELGYRTWKLDGIYTSGEEFVKIARLFAEAKEQLEQGTWTQEQARQAQEEISKWHPENRGLDTGFYHVDHTKIR